MTKKVVSYQIADTIDVKQFSAAFKAELYYSDPSELFYKMDTDQYVYVFKYGAVCFLNFDPVGISQFVKLITPYCKTIFADSFTEEYLVATNCREVRVGFNHIDVPMANTDVLRLVMLVVSQSVALDYYQEQTSKLLEEANFHTQVLVNKGKLAISDKKLKQFIGNTLLLRNRIAENIYVFDSPPETWEDESLNKINNELKRTFDLQVRVRTIVEGLAIIRDNLELFRTLLEHRYSNMLEWIVIVLILVEVINLVVEKLF
jgi:required for meiotic nuclear division protein 1